MVDHLIISTKKKSRWEILTVKKKDSKKNPYEFLPKTSHLRYEIHEMRIFFSIAWGTQKLLGAVGYSG